MLRCRHGDQHAIESEFANISAAVGYTGRPCSRSWAAAASNGSVIGHGPPPRRRQHRGHQPHPRAGRSGWRRRCPGSTAGFGDLPAALAAADLVISCTGATGLVITAGMAAEALRLLPGAAGEAETRPLAMLDLALPHDVDRAAAGLPGVSVLGLDSLEAAGLAVAVTQADDVAAVRAIVAEELAARISARHAARVSPTVVALRAKAAEVVEAELDRLTGKLGAAGRAGQGGDLAGDAAGVVGKLLHAPTVRVKELACSPGGDSYEAALRVLFDLDQDAIDSVTRADWDVTLGGGG